MRNLTLDELKVLGGIYLESETMLFESEWMYFLDQLYNGYQFYLLSPQQMQECVNLKNKYGYVNIEEINVEANFFHKRAFMIVRIEEEGCVDIKFCFPYDNWNGDKFASVYGTSDYYYLEKKFLIKFIDKVTRFLRDQGWSSFMVYVPRNEGENWEEFAKELGAYSSYNNAGMGFSMQFVL